MLLAEPQQVLPQLQRAKQQSEIIEHGPEPLVTGSYSGPAPGVAVWFAAQRVTVGLPSELPEGATVTIDADEPTPAGDVLEVVANQLNSEARVLRRGARLYMLGEPSHTDMVSRVYYVSADSATSFESAVKVLTTKHAEVRAVADMVVVRDTPTGIAAADSLWAAMFSARGQYLVELRFVEVSRNWSQTVGLDWSLVGAVDLSSVLSSGGSSVTAMAAGQLAAMLRADETTDGVRLLTMSRLHVVEGEDAMLQVGQTTPVPRRTVSDQGTVTTTSYDQVDTGVIVHVGIRTEPDGRLRVRLQPELSDVTGFVDDAPIRARRRMTTSAVVEPGGVVVIGGFTREHERDGNAGLPGLMGLGRREQGTDATRLFILLRVVDPSLEVVSDDDAPAES